MHGARARGTSIAARAWVAGLLSLVLMVGCMVSSGARAGGRGAAPERPPPPSTTEAQAWGHPHLSSMPAFPWPPPAASATAHLPQMLFADLPSFRTLGDFDAVLQRGLLQTGYGESSYYAIPGGFALVTRLEQIERDGTPKSGDRRWIIGPSRIREFSLREYLRALFTANPGYFRIIVFAVTDVPVEQSDARVTDDDAGAWLQHGRRNGLPPEVAALPWRPQITCTALIYEFILEQGQKEASLMTSSVPDGPTHLMKANLWSALRLRWGWW